MIAEYLVIDCSQPSSVLSPGPRSIPTSTTAPTTAHHTIHKANMTHFSALRTLKSMLAASFAAGLMFAATSASAQTTPGVLRVSAIPDEAPTELQRKFKPLGDYLAKATGL